MRAYKHVKNCHFTHDGGLAIGKRALFPSGRNSFAACTYSRTRAPPHTLTHIHAAHARTPARIHVHADAATVNKPIHTAHAVLPPLTSPHSPLPSLEAHDVAALCIRARAFGEARCMHGPFHATHAHTHVTAAATAAAAVHPRAHLPVGMGAHGQTASASTGSGCAQGQRGNRARAGDA